MLRPLPLVSNPYTESMGEAGMLLPAAEYCRAVEIAADHRIADDVGYGFDRVAGRDEICRSTNLLRGSGEQRWRLVQKAPTRRPRKRSPIQA